MITFTTLAARSNNMSRDDYVRAEQSGGLTRPLTLGYSAPRSRQRDHGSPAATRTTPAERALLEGCAPKVSDPRRQAVKS